MVVHGAGAAAPPVQNIVAGQAAPVTELVPDAQ